MKSESEAELLKKYKEICLDLNLDKTAQEEAWQSFQRIGVNFTLEGEKLHWLACALYEACRKGTTPTVSKGGYVTGNCVSLVRLLRSCKLSLVQFFNKMKKWSDMANMDQQMRQKIDHLDRNFNVQTCIWKKFKPIFLFVFQDPKDCQPRQAKNRKQKNKQTLTSLDVFTFCWTLFIFVKSNFPQISNDLVNSYHLLLATIDYCYFNALHSPNAKELINAEFPGLPSDFNSPSFRPSERPCILNQLCQEFNGIAVEAKGIKEHWLKTYIAKQVHKGVLKCKIQPPLSGIFDSVASFEANRKSIENAYNTYVLNYGDLDESIFLLDSAEEELGTLENATDLAEQIQHKQNIKEHVKHTKTLCPSTPLTMRHLGNRREIQPSTPVSSATQSVSRLQSLLLNREDKPSAEMDKIFKECAVNPSEQLGRRVKEWGEKFLAAYCSSDENEHEHAFPNDREFATRRLNLAVALFYKSLENIITREKSKMPSEKIPQNLASMLSNERVTLSLFVCCMEVILHAYNSSKTFPWLLTDVFTELPPYYFYKIIEPFVREEDGLPREVVKHLNTSEEKVLESLAWKSESPVWDAIRQHGVPSCIEVSLPNQGDPNTPLLSPIGKREQKSRKSLLGDGEPQYVQVAVPAKNASGEIVFVLQQLQMVQTVPVAADTPPSSTTPPRPVKGGPLPLFFRKVYYMAALRLSDMYKGLNIVDEKLQQKIWTCFEHILCHNIDLMRDRHIDQLLMCTVYSICKITQNPQTFQDIMRVYRLQPQALSHVYRSVLLTSRKRRNSGSSDVSRNSGSNSPPLQEERERIRSSSTMPVPTPSSQPPTPTKMSGSYSAFEFEERGDLIAFYNQLFLRDMTQYLSQFSLRHTTAIDNSPPLSPMPKLNANAGASRKIPNHSLYVSPLKNAANFPPSPHRPMSYRFSDFRSPAKELKTINNSMRASSKRVVKRMILEDEVDGAESSPAKRNCGDGNNIHNRMIMGVVSDRHAVVENGGNV